LRTLSDLANTLVPIAHLLIRRDLGAGAFVLAVKLAYLRAAVEAVGLRGSRPNISRLSVITGMTRKEVALLLKYKDRSAAHAHSSVGMEQRALRVIRGWSSDPMFKTRNGHPAQLNIRAGEQNFSALVRAYGGDVTPGSVLKELERINAVAWSRKGKLMLRKVKPKQHLRSSHQLADFALLLRDFTDAARQSIQPGPASLFFGFRDLLLPDESHAALFHRTFGRRAAVLLGGVEEWRTRQLGQKVKKLPRATPTKRVGVGIYFVHEDSSTVGQRNLGPRRDAV
jgi:Family of unknown function (DUF6502)